MSESSGEKTEQPTSKKLKDAKKKGQVAKSQDLSSAVLLLVAVGVLWLGGNFLGEVAIESVKEQYTSATAFTGEITEDVAFAAFGKGLITFAMILAPLFVIIWLMAFVVNFLQVGSIYAPESITPKFSKLNPTEGFKNKFLKLRPYVELLKTVFKMAITAVVAGTVLWAARGDVVLLSSQPIDVSIAYTFGLIIEIGFKIGLVFLILGAGDYFLQSYMHKRDMKMTKHEVKQEYKETEGNPQIKQQRKAIHREILAEGMAAAVKQADVVVANPTHVAVALKYDKSKSEAPIIVAKGADLMAAKIREIAKDSDVPITRDIPLARTLYELEVNDEIPEELFEAVAIVLRWVYEMAEENGQILNTVGVVNG